MDLFGIPEGTKFSSDKGPTGQALESMESAGGITEITPPESPAEFADGDLLGKIQAFVEGKTNEAPDLSKATDPVLAARISEHAPSAQASGQPAPPPAPEPGPQPADPKPTASQLDPNVQALMQQNQAIIQHMAAMQQNMTQAMQPQAPQPREPTVAEKAQLMQTMGMDPSDPSAHVTFNVMQANQQLTAQIEAMNSQLHQMQAQSYEAQLGAHAVQHTDAVLKAEFSDREIPAATRHAIASQVHSFMQAGYDAGAALQGAMQGYRPLLQNLPGKKAATAPASPAPSKTVPGVTHPGLAAFANNPQFQGMNPQQLGALLQAAGAPSLQGAGAGRHGTGKPFSMSDVDGLLFS